MYLIIRNFNCVIWQKQAQLSIILIEFTFIVLSKSYKNIKAILWQKALLIILKCEYKINLIKS